MVGDDNRKVVVHIPMQTTVQYIREVIAENFIIPSKHIMNIHLEKSVISTSDNDLSPQYIDMFKSVDMSRAITLSDYIRAGDSIYVSNASSFCDPNVWKLNQEWKVLMDEASKINESKLMSFVELLTKICENIIEHPHNERYRHLNYMKIKKKIQGIPRALKIFKCIGFILKPNGKDFNFYVMHSLKPLKHFLRCVYIKYPQLRPVDPQFMAQFESFDVTQNMFECEKKEQEQKLKQLMEERKKFYQTAQPNVDAIIPPSRGTKIANVFHVILENAVLFVVIVTVFWWLIRAIFWPFFTD